MENPGIDQSIVFLPTQDIHANHRFFADGLGLELALDQGSCRIYRVAGTAYLGFCSGGEPHENPYRTIVTIVTDDLDGWRQRLDEKGIPTDGAPRHNPSFHITHFFAKSPDGYRVEFQRFENPKWNEHLEKISSG